MKPFVSVLTPTYNRRKFIPALIQTYKSQTYPLNRMEWIILDDGQESVEDLFEEAKKWIPNLRYYREETKLMIGAKRNKLNSYAKGEILVAMDDDDYYCPERVAHVVQKFQQNPSIELAGSSELYMYYTDVKKILKLGPYNERHCTNGTLATRASYAKSHKYDEHVTHAEEKSFLDSFKNPMIQLDPFKTMLVISHSENTFNKKKFLDELEHRINPFVKLTTLKIKDWIKEPTLRNFYASA
jgi:glycosyltransferase involved in cell wall biosynthesis